jgi:hypothetical protein
MNNLDATVFVYRHRSTGEVRCTYVDGNLDKNPEWVHEASLEPRLWIQAHWDEITVEKDHMPLFDDWGSWQK